MSAVEQMKTRHITSFKASSQGAKRSLDEKETFFVYSNMVSEIPIKENQSQSHVKRKWPDGWSGGGEEAITTYFRQRRAINRGTTIIGGNTTPSNCSSFQIREGRLKSLLKHPLNRCLIVCVLLIYLTVLPLPVVPPALAIYPLNGNYTTEDLLQRPVIKGVAHNVELVDGPYNVPDGAYQFKGQANSYIEFPNGNLILDAKYSITLMCWVKPGGKDGPLFNYNKNDWGVHIWLAQAGRFFVRITKAGSHAFHPFVQTVNPLPIGKWAHVAATYDFNTGYNAIYVDGVLQAPSKNVGRGSPSIPISTNDPEVRMGARLSDGRYFNGAICQMGIWNVALTQEQIAVEMMRKKGNFKACARMSANLSYLHMGYRSLEIPHFHIDLNAHC